MLTAMQIVHCGSTAQIPVTIGRYRPLNASVTDMHDMQTEAAHLKALHRVHISTCTEANLQLLHNLSAYRVGSTKAQV